MDSLELIRGNSVALREAVDEELSMLGETAKAILYRKLERDFQLRSVDVPQKFEEFSSALDKILGPGAAVLVRFIVNRYHRKIGKQASLSIDLSETSQGITMPQKEPKPEIVRPSSMRGIQLKSIPDVTTDSH